MTAEQQPYINITDKVICVTGGSGFIGKKLIEELSKLRCSIKILTRNEGGDFPKNADVFIGDLTNPNISLKEFIEGCDVLFHCAGEIINQERMRLLHVNGTQKLINAVHEEYLSSKKVIHWIQLSSCGVYGPPPKNNLQIKRVITELSETRPESEYEKTKTESDEIVLSSSDERMAYTILRSTHVIGPTMTNQSVRILIRFVKSGLFFFIGRKDAIAGFVHVEDVVSAMITITNNPKSKNEIFNISNDCNWEDLIFKIASTLNVKIHPLRIPLIFIQPPLYIATLLIGRFKKIPPLCMFADRTNYSTTKIESYLNYKFSKPMPESIEDLLISQK